MSRDSSTPYHGAVQSEGKHAGRIGLKMTTVNELITTCPYCSVGEASALMHFGSLTPSRPQLYNVVMLGAGPGELLMAYLEGCGYTKTVNSHIIDNDTCNWANLHIASDDKISSTNKLRLKLHIGDSAEAGKMWFETVDLLIVDADHSPEGVRKDLVAWTPNLSNDAKIWFHDYDEAKTVIDNWAKRHKWTELLEVGCSKVFSV